MNAQKILNMSNNSLCYSNPHDAKFIADRLKTNPNIEELDLSQNYFADKGTAIVAAGLVDNFSLLKLNLERNYVHNDGLNSLAEALSVNNSLQELNLSNNEFTDAAAEKLIQSLENNTTLIKLDLTGNQISDAHLKQIAEILARNQALAAKGTSIVLTLMEKTNQLEKKFSEHLFKPKTIFGFEYKGYEKKPELPTYAAQLKELLKEKPSTDNKKDWLSYDRKIRNILSNWSHSFMPGQDKKFAENLQSSFMNYNIRR